MSVQGTTYPNAIPASHPGCNDKNTGSKKHPLPDNFVPGDSDIIIGRGKKCYNHVGNLDLRRIVGSKMEQYLAAKCKIEKSVIISSIVDEIRHNGKGHFVKENPNAKGHWFDVGDIIAREKIAQAFRDALHDNYRSSTSFKKKRRQQRRRIQAAQNFQAWKISQYMQQMQKNSRGITAFSTQNQNQLPVPMCLQPQCGTNDLVEKLSMLLPAKCFEDENPFEPVPISNKLQIAGAACSNNVNCSRENWVPKWETQCRSPSGTSDVCYAFDSLPSSNIHAAMTA